jgi:uncharacterized membrane protein YraQ (UPF0718 family)
MSSASDAIPFYPKLMSAAKTPWAFSVGLLVAVMVIDPAQFQDVFVFAIDALVGTAPYILFAIILIAYLKSTGAEVKVADAFKGKEVKMIFMAALFGGLAPFCSCEVIPFIAALLALGAPLSAVMAFWLSSPLIDPPTLLITAAALGWPFAIGKAVSAIFLGLFGGFGIYLMTRQGVFSAPLRPRQGASGCCNAPKLDGKPQWVFWQDADRRTQFKEEFSSNGLFLLKWLTLAYVLEALMIFYVPSDFIAALVGGEGVASVATAAVVGMPAYLNSYVAPPLLAGLMEQGMSAGAAMAFMVAGSISSIPAMMAVWSLVKKQVFTAYIGIGLAGAILSGLVFQMII